MAEDGTAEQRAKASSHQLLPKHVGQKITVRSAQGQPITGILRGYNPYELLIEVGPSSSSSSIAQSGALRSRARAGVGRRGGGPGRGRNPSIKYLQKGRQKTPTYLGF
jgi:hypothetical protein